MNAVAIIMLLLASPLFAQEYKCVENGKVTYSGTPCQTTKEASSQQPKEPQTAADIQAAFEREVTAKNEKRELDKLRAEEAAKIRVTPASIPATPTPKTETKTASIDKGLVVFLLFVYFIPAIIAFNRSHQNTTAITVLNILLGWTLLGWIVAIVWAFTAVKTKEGDKASA